MIEWRAIDQLRSEYTATIVGVNEDSAIQYSLRANSVEHAGHVESLLRDLAESWVLGTEGPDTWSAFDVLGHLIHREETDWIPRAKSDHGCDSSPRSWHQSVTSSYSQQA